MHAPRLRDLRGAALAQAAAGLVRLYERLGFRAYGETTEYEPVTGGP